MREQGIIAQSKKKKLDPIGQMNQLASMGKSMGFQNFEPIIKEED